MRARTQQKMNQMKQQQKIRESVSNDGQHSDCVVFSTAAADLISFRFSSRFVEWSQQATIVVHTISHTASTKYLLELIYILYHHRWWWRGKWMLAYAFLFQFIHLNDFSFLIDNVFFFFFFFVWLHFSSLLNLCALF